MTFTVLIPARLASTRLPNKPLADLAGMPMVVRVARRVLDDPGSTERVRVVVACDSEQIVDACTAHGVQAILTRTDHVSGSDRLAEACAILGLPDTAVVVNVQGDEPLIAPALVHAVARLLTTDPGASMSTAAHRIETLEELRNPNIVKVVLDASGRALYFSRSPIPCGRDFPDQVWWQGGAAASNSLLEQAAPLRHIGIYAYRVGFLRQFPDMARAPLEVAEALEQLRAMWHGHRIAVHVASHAPGPGVDTPQDLEHVRRLLAN